MRSRRGQTPTPSFRNSAATLVLLLGLLLLLYVLFLPPDMRESLLTGTPGGTGTSGNTGTGGYGSGGVLILSKYVGTLNPLGTGTIEHPIPSATVYTAINAQEIKTLDSLLIKRGAFSRQDGVVTFSVDPSMGRNFLLTFNADVSRGPLRIQLNGVTIFERTLTSKSPEPIKLPQEYVQEQNTLTFSTDSPGWQFWIANEQQLRNVLISGDVMDISGASSAQHFTIAADELQRAQKGVVEFVAQCDPRQGGRLTVQVNGQLLYTGLPDCGVVTRQDVSKEFLKEGDNALGFISNFGSYMMERVKFVSVLQKEDYPVFYFNLPPDMFQQLNTANARLLLTVRFAEGNDQKRGVIVVNGFKHSFETQNLIYQATIDPNVLIPNANAIQIQPQTSTLNVAELRVELV